MIAPAHLGPDGISVAERQAWVDGPRWDPLYRRLGPLRYSDLGRRRLVPLADPEPVARWLAAAADRWWAAKGRPDPFTLVVVSGDDGRLAAAVLGAEPACAPALRYVLVDLDWTDPGFPTASLAGSLPLENPAFLYPAAPTPAGVDADDEIEPRPAQGIGPMVTLLSDRPGFGDGGVASVVVAVELLSRLAYDAYELGEDASWAELRLTAGEEGWGEIRVPMAAAPDGVDGGPNPGRQLRWTGAATWLRAVIASGDTSTLAVVDAPLPAHLLGAAGRGAEPSEAIEGSPLRSVQWRLG